MAGALHPTGTHGDAQPLHGAPVSSGPSLSHGGWPQKGTGPPVSQPRGHFPRQPPAGRSGGRSPARGPGMLPLHQAPAMAPSSPPPSSTQPPALTRAGLSLVS